MPGVCAVVNGVPGGQFGVPVAGAGILLAVVIDRHHPIDGGIDSGPDAAPELALIQRD